MKGIKKRSYKSRRDDIVVDPCPDCVAHNVPIGTQNWTGCNATVSLYRNGDTIPYVGNIAAWAALTTGAWCYVNGDPSTEATYGKLYNWYAVTDPRGIAPVGYKVPTDAEWTTLTTFLGGELVAGGKMKEEGLCHWLPNNIDATNTSLFTGLGTGYRDSGGYFNNMNNLAFWWSSTESSTSNTWVRNLIHGDGVTTRSNINKKSGLSLRFIEDPCPDCVAHDVTIGTQNWAGCNATVSTYRDLTPIPYVDDPVVWASLTTGAWCWYNNDSANEATYGKLYNWHAVNDPRGLAPAGYHVPSEAEFITLTNNLGSASVAGGKLKESGFCHWLTPNTDATNTSGFTALPGGTRISTGSYVAIKTYGEWWTSTSVNSTNARHFYLINFSAVSTIDNYFKTGGFSVRFIKDPVVICPDKVIGTQTWATCNLDVDKYRNGDSIPQITDNTLWDQATTGAWCWYNNDPLNGTTYKKLYNYYAITDPRGLAPSGYHIPTDAEWATLTAYAGGNPIAGGPLKEAGTAHWQTPNTLADNGTEFTALPGGFRGAAGGFGFLTQYGYYRTDSNVFGLAYNSTVVFPVSNTFSYGFSVRVIKD